MTQLDDLLRQYEIDPDRVAREVTRSLIVPTPLTGRERDLLAEGGLDMGAVPDVAARVRDVVVDAAEVRSFPDVRQVATANGVTSSRVRHWAANAELVSVTVDGQLRFPSFQFDATGRVLPGIRKVSPHVPDEWSWRGYRDFLAAVNQDLEVDRAAVSPAVWLTMGKDPATVMGLMGTDW